MWVRHSHPTRVIVHLSLNNRQMHHEWSYVHKIKITLTTNTTVSHPSQHFDKKRREYARRTVALLNSCCNRLSDLAHIHFGIAGDESCKTTTTSHVETAVRRGIPRGRRRRMWCGNNQIASVCFCCGCAKRVCRPKTLAKNWCPFVDCQ